MLASFEKAAVVVSRKLVMGTAATHAGVVVGGTVKFPPYFSSSSVLCQCRLFSQYSHNHRNNKWNDDSSHNQSHHQQQQSSSSRGGGERGEFRGGHRGRRGSGSGGGRNTLTPVRVSQSHGRNMQQVREEERMEMTMKEYKQEFRREIRQYGDPVEEPNSDLFSKTFDDYIQESEQLKDRIKTTRMTKKHFGHMNPYKKELNLLTWAEKENIRYLCESDPEQWTPEAIAQAFPISEGNVMKLVRSGLRLRRVKDVQAHDAMVASRMKDINEGVIPMTEELERRLKIRDAIPMRYGDLGMHPDQYVDMSLPTKLGEFARLVAPRQIQKKEEQKKEEPVVKKCFGEGDFHDSSSPPRGNVPLEPQLSKEQLRRILPTHKVMTFSEFEHRMEKKGAGEKAGDMKYMLEELRHTNPTTSTKPSTTEDFELPLGQEVNPQFPSNIQKYKKPEETGQLVEVQVEGQQAYLYQPDTGYQKPYGATTNSVGKGADPPERIIIPDELRGKPGATYKVGNCYYDEDGEFLYRVI